MSPALTRFRGLPRLGLASRGDNQLTEADVHLALERGVRFLNWCGTPNAMSRAIADLGPRRREVMICVQFEARMAEDAATELASIRRELRTDTIDVITFYYVEAQEEWDQIAGPRGALAYCREVQRDGGIGLLGLTSHQRALAAGWAATGLLDLLMIRYNAAHRGAETDVFPVTDRLGMPVIAYTCLRWGGLLKPTPADPPGFVVPRAPAWYRFVLRHPSVTVALMAPDNGTELAEDLSVLDSSKPLSEDEYQSLAEHGARVRQFGGSFP